jgi:hypothetical protein
MIASYHRNINNEMYTNNDNFIKPGAYFRKSKSKHSFDIAKKK